MEIIKTIEINNEKYNIKNYYEIEINSEKNVTNKPIGIFKIINIGKDVFEIEQLKINIYKCLLNEVQINSSKYTIDIITSKKQLMKMLNMRVINKYKYYQNVFKLMYIITENVEIKNVSILITEEKFIDEHLKIYICELKPVE